MLITSRIVVAFLVTLLCGVPALAAEPVPAPAKVEVEASEAALMVLNRRVAVFRGPFLGISAEKRAIRARAAIEEILRTGGDLKVTVKSNPEGQLILIDDALAFVITQSDVDPLKMEAPQKTAERAAANLRQVIAETLEARTFDAILKAAIAAGAATLVFLLLVWVVSRLHRRIAQIMIAIAERGAHKLKVAQTSVLERSHIVHLIGRAVTVLKWLIIALLTYEWLTFVLSRFPYTRPWGESLNGYLVGVVTGIGIGIVEALPGLGIAIAIFALARFTTAFLRGLLERLSEGGTSLSWLAPDTMATTRRLINVGIWVFALAMAYPYLPGSQTEAFKGISVLVGLMVSLGASSVVGQGAAGLILTYTRTLRVGEYVRIGEHEGTVTRLGAFTSSIRTGLGEELTIPNSLITGTVTKNYSRAVQGTGYIVDTTVTIGYDTPWRQVEAMLIEAARRTPGVLADPSPRVFQTKLADWYPEYRLVAQAIPSAPLPRAEVLTRLHANIQDVFNEYGVQIMSPNYVLDPPQAKVVKPEDWYAAPAQKPAAAEQS